MAGRKKVRPLDGYLKLGGEFKALLYLLRIVSTDACSFLTKSEMASLFTAWKAINRARSKAEDCMFRDNPDLPNDYLKVFYGVYSEYPTSGNSVEVETFMRSNRIMQDLVAGALKKEALDTKM